MANNAVEVDTLIEPSWVIPINPSNKVLTNFSIAIKDSKIVSIHPSCDNSTRFNALDQIKLDDHVLMPGFVNTHTHAAMTLLRGYADDLPLMRWLSDHIWPAESEFVSAKFVHDGTLLACAEMLRGGTTCFNDMYFFPLHAGQAAIKAGIRAVLGITVIEFPNNYAADPQDYLRKGLEARDLLNSEPLINFTMSPHSPYTVSDKTFEQISVLANQLHLPIHVHIHETKTEIEDSLKQYGKRPIARFDTLGLLSPSLVGVHAVHIDDVEISLMANQGSSVVHCPSSNLKLASGFSPIGKLLRKNINVAIGTDGAASNNRLDMLAETRLAALMAKAVDGLAETLPAHQALHMATLAGARALGLDDQIGSIEKGKLADLIAIDLSQIETQPNFDVASQIIYAAGRENVTNVWVNGERVLKNKFFKNAISDTISQKTSFWTTQILNKRTN